MKYLFTVMVGLFAMSANAQELNKKIEDKIKHKQVMLNECSRDSLVAFPEFKASYDTHYQNYKVDSVAALKIQKLLKTKKVKVVLGTWCGDSKYQVPVFLKVADAAKLNAKNLTIIGVDGEKKAEAGLLDGLNIERVPTFIFTDKKGVEIGRITETPRKTFEIDMIELLTPKK